MNPYQQDVRDFHVALDLPVDTCGCTKGHLPRERAELRATLIEEEAGETVEALRNRHLVPTIDGMIDTLVVVFGTAVEMGVDLDIFWREVHASNMAKQGGPMREDGKVLKPDGWKPPNLAGLIMHGEGNYVNADGMPVDAEASS